MISNKERFLVPKTFSEETQMATQKRTFSNYFDINQLAHADGTVDRPERQTKKKKVEVI